MLEATVSLMWFLLTAPWLILQVYIVFYTEGENKNLGLGYYFLFQILAILGLIMITARAYV
jgi:hypothetical protein